MEQCVDCKNAEGKIREKSTKILRCKKCYGKMRRIKGAEVRSAYNEKTRDRQQKWRDDHKSENIAYQAKYRKDHPEIISKCRIDWAINNHEKILRCKRDMFARRYTKDLKYTLAKQLRCRFKSAFKLNVKTGSAIKDLGCSIDQLRKHLESLFEPGMSWDNHNLLGWHIDHKHPLSSFDLTDIQQVREACHYTNLQPLWAKDNLVKGSKCG
jgi:hypothetical protein